jgi:hypothetical protein
MDGRKPLAALACIGVALSMAPPSRADERTAASCDAALHIVSEIISENPTAGWVVDDPADVPVQRKEAKQTPASGGIPIQPIRSGLDPDGARGWDGLPPLPSQTYSALPHFEALRCPQVQAYLGSQNISFGHPSRQKAGNRGVIEIASLRLTGDGSDAFAVVNVERPLAGRGFTLHLKRLEDGHWKTVGRYHRWSS